MKHLISNLTAFILGIVLMVVNPALTTYAAATATNLESFHLIMLCANLILCGFGIFALLKYRFAG